MRRAGCISCIIKFNQHTALTTFERVALDLEHHAFAELAQALRDRSDRILKRWRAVSLEAMPYLDALTLKEFENTIAQILDALADALQSKDPQQLRGVIENAPQHGLDRFAQQGTLLDAFEEVRILRSVIILELADEMQRPLDVGESASFHAIFDIIIQQGVMALVNKQKEELAQNEERLERAVADRTAELEKSHQRLLMTGRMAAVGTLAAGLAHDIANLLMPLEARVAVLLAKKSIDPDVHNELAVITALLDHLRDLSHNLALFSRDPDMEGITGSTEVAKWCASVQGLLDASVGREVLIQWKCPDDLPAVAVAPHRLTQAVQNLIHNARDAVLAAKAKVPNRVPRIGVDWNRCSTNPADGGNWVILSVSDNGIGMDAETQRRCIEPFFTTHQRPQEHGMSGSGLGLALVRQIIERAGGEMEINSQPDQGTTIRLKLPIADP